MKANAPEKIYLPYKDDRLVGLVKTEGVKFNSGVDGHIEYTRTDAFIEKACEWLSDNLQTIVDVESPSKHHVETIPALGSITQTEFLEKFKKDIKYLID